MLGQPEGRKIILNLILILIILWIDLLFQLWTPILNSSQNLIWLKYNIYVNLYFCKKNLSQISDQILAKIEAVFLCHYRQGNINVSTVLQKTLDYKSRSDERKLLRGLVHINSCLVCFACWLSVWDVVHFALWSE